jgi:hypothetical protein
MRHLVGLALVCACKLPSTLGLPCEVDAHCDAEQHCGADGRCHEGPGSDTGASTGTAGDSTTSVTTTTEAATEADPTFDSDPTMEGSESSTTGPACGREVGLCDSIDILFLVDNSGSMNDVVSKLIPAFTNINELLGGAISGFCSYRIGVTSTEVAPDYQDPECQVRGALHRSGALLGGQSCFSDPDHPPWVSEEDNLSTLGCLLAVGQNYDTDEKQLETVLAALGPELAAPGACNEGFLRDDAALLIVIVSDEDDDDDSMKPNEAPDRTGSAGDPGDWFSELTAIKPASNIGVLALVANDPAGCDWMPAPGLSDGTGAEYAERILTFMQHFTGAGYATHIRAGNICNDADELVFELASVSVVVASVCADAVF